MTSWHVRDRLRVLPGGDLLVHALVFVVGAAFIALGLALVVLPGPLTIPPVLVGLFVWSLEFAFAERLLVKARRSAASAWDAARRAPWRTGLVTGSGLLLAVLAGVLVSRYGAGDLLDRARAALG